MKALEEAKKIKKEMKKAKKEMKKEEKKSDEFRVAANARYRQVLLWANDQEMEEVRNLLVKLGELVSFHLGPAVVAFVMCVVMSLIASIMFDPHAIWEESATNEEYKATV